MNPQQPRHLHARLAEVGGLDSISRERFMCEDDVENARD